MNLKFFLFNFVFILFSFGAISKPFPAAPVTADQTQALECRSILANLKPVAERPFGKSVGSIIVANAALLAATETARHLTGWEHAFDTPFFFNSAIDMIITPLSQGIAVGGPVFLKKLFKGDRGTLVRSGANTVLNTLVVLGVWKIASLSGTGTISLRDAGLALGLCGGYYFGIQHLKNWLFVKLPRKLDKKYESRLLSILSDEARAEVERVRANLSEDQNFLDSLDRSVHEQEVMALGHPFTEQESRAIRALLKDRKHFQGRLIRVGAMGDQFVGVVIAGGFLLRGVTQIALSD